MYIKFLFDNNKKIAMNNTECSSDCEERAKTVVITGASSGLGAELARQYGNLKDVRLVLTARRIDKLRCVRDEVLKCGACEVYIIKTDVRDECQCDRLIKFSIKKLGCIDILILNAGVGMYSCFNEIEDIEMFKTIMETNYFGVLYCIKSALTHMRDNGTKLVITSSIAALTAFPSQSIYAASKHAIEGLVNSFRKEQCSDNDFKIIVVYPSGISTEIHEKLLLSDGTLSGDDQDFLNEYNCRGIYFMPVELAAKNYICGIEKADCKGRVFLDEYNRLGDTIRPFSARIADFMTYLSIKIPYDDHLYNLPLRYYHAIKEAKQFEKDIKLCGKEQCDCETECNCENTLIQTEFCNKMGKIIDMNKSHGWIDGLPRDYQSKIVNFYLNK